jgi:8-oxo-dGTP diphosphatase
MGAPEGAERPESAKDVTAMKDGRVFGEKIVGIDYRARTGVYGVVAGEGNTTAVVRIPVGYFLIGGGIEQGEDREEALRREFLEETGYTIEIGEYLGTSSGYYYSKGFGRYMHGIGHFYRVKLLKKVTEQVEADHTLVWVGPRECAELIAYDYQRWAVVTAFGLE